MQNGTSPFTISQNTDVYHEPFSQRDQPIPATTMTTMGDAPRDKSRAQRPSGSTSRRGGEDEVLGSGSWPSLSLSLDLSSASLVSAPGLPAPNADAAASPVAPSPTRKRSSRHRQPRASATTAASSTTRDTPNAAGIKPNTPLTNPFATPASQMGFSPVQQSTASSPASNPFVTPSAEFPTSPTTTRSAEPPKSDSVSMPRRIQVSATMEMQDGSNNSLTESPTKERRSQSRLDLNRQDNKENNVGGDTRDRSKKRSARQRQPSYQVKSPVADDYVVIAIEDMLDSHGRPLNAKGKKHRRDKRRDRAQHDHRKTTGDEGTAESSTNLFPSLSSELTTAAEDDALQSQSSQSQSLANIGGHVVFPLGPIDATVPRSADPPQVMFVQNYGKYRKVQDKHMFGHIDKYDGVKRRRQQVHAISTPIRWPVQLTRLAQRVQKCTHSLFFLIHSLYAGLCLFALLALPTPFNSSMPTTAALATTQNISTTNAVTQLTSTSYTFDVTVLQDTELISDPSFQFLLMYISKMGVILANILDVGSMLALFAVLECVGVASFHLGVFGYKGHSGVNGGTGKASGGVFDRQLVDANGMDASKPHEVAVNVASSRSQLSINPADQSTKHTLTGTALIGSSSNLDNQYSMTENNSSPSLSTLFKTLLSDWRLIFRLVIVTTSIISCVYAALLAPINTRLLSVITDSFGSVYGTNPKWFYDPSKITDTRLVGDLDAWKRYNFARGVTGLVAWVLHVAALDPRRLLRLTLRPGRSLSETPMMVDTDAT